MHQLPAHSCLVCSEGHLQCSRRDRFCFLKVQLSFLCPGAFHGSLLPTVLSPNKSKSSAALEGFQPAPPYPRQPLLILPHSICTLLRPVALLNAAHTEPVPALSPPTQMPPTPYHLSLSRPQTSMKSSCLEAPPDSSLPQGRAMICFPYVSKYGVRAGTKSYSSHMSHLSTDVGMSNALKNLNSRWKLAKCS